MRAQKALILWSFLERNQVDEENRSAGESTSASDSGNGAADDEGSRTGSGCANDGANLEDDGDGDEGPFSREEGLVCRE